jgi:hypothetical protein
MLAEARRYWLDRFTLERLWSWPRAYSGLGTPGPSFGSSLPLQLRQC